MLIYSCQYAFSGHSAAEGRQIAAAARNPKMPPENPKMPPISRFEDSWGIWPTNIKYFDPKCRQ